MTAAAPGGTGVRPVFPVKFPLTLSIAVILTTGLALAAAALNLQWSAGSPTPDALDRAWHYVNLATLYTVLALWPALALARPILTLATILLDALALLAACLPAFILAAFLSSPDNLPHTLLAHLALLLLSAGALSHHARLPRPLLAGLLAGFTLITPLLAYLAAEFFPDANDAWQSFVPLLAVTSASWYPPAAYALLGAAFLSTAPRSRSIPITD